MKKKLLILLTLAILSLTFCLTGCGKGVVSNVKDISSFGEYYITKTPSYKKIDLADGCDGVVDYKNGVAIFNKGDAKLGVFTNLTDKSVEATEMEIFEYKFNTEKFYGLIVKNVENYDFYDALGNKFISKADRAWSQTANIMLLDGAIYKINQDGGVSLDESGNEFDGSVLPDIRIEANGKYYVRAYTANNGRVNYSNALAVYDEYGNMLNTFNFATYKDIVWSPMDNGNVLVQLETHMESTTGNFSYMTKDGEKKKVETFIWNPVTDDVKELDYKFKIIKLYNDKVTDAFDFNKVFAEKVENYALVLPFDKEILYNNSKNVQDLTAVFIENDGDLIAKTDFVVIQVAEAYSAEFLGNWSYPQRIVAPFGAGKWQTLDDYGMVKLVNDKNQVIYQGKDVYYQGNYIIKTSDGVKKIYQGEKEIYTLSNGEGCYAYVDCVFVWTTLGGFSKITAEGLIPVDGVTPYANGYVLKVGEGYEYYLNGEKILTSDSIVKLGDFIIYTDNSVTKFLLTENA